MNAQKCNLDESKDEKTKTLQEDGDTRKPKPRPYRQTTDDCGSRVVRKSFMPRVGRIRASHLPLLLLKMVRAKEKGPLSTVVVHAACVTPTFFSYVVSGAADNLSAYAKHVHQGFSVVLKQSKGHKADGHSILSNRKFKEGKFADLDEMQKAVHFRIQIAMILALQFYFECRERNRSVRGFCIRKVYEEMTIMVQEHIRDIGPHTGKNTGKLKEQDEVVFQFALPPRLPGETEEELREQMQSLVEGFLEETTWMQEFFDVPENFFVGEDEAVKEATEAYEDFCFAQEDAREAFKTDKEAAFPPGTLQMVELFDVNIQGREPDITEPPDGAGEAQAARPDV